MTRDLQVVRSKPEAASRRLDEVTPPAIFAELRRGVLGQDRALRYAAVAIHKHTTGCASGNMLLIGSSGTGKTTIMNTIQRLYDTLPEYRPFRVMTILNANLLLDSDRCEFRADQLLAGVERRARAILGPRPTAGELAEAMERATVCIDEVDKMSSLVVGRANPGGAVVQQGLLTLMEGERVAHRTAPSPRGGEQPTTLELDTGRMMFVCGGAFEGLYDQVRDRVTHGSEAMKLPTETVRTADGHVRIIERFDLGAFLKLKDLFTFGMVPQFVSRFDKLVLLEDLSVDTLKQILLVARDSPFVRSRRYFADRGIRLEIEEMAASLIAERAASEPRSGARALRDLFSRVANRYEYDPPGERLETLPDGSRRLVIDAAAVREVLS